jgi:hypothetical protein
VAAQHFQALLYLILKPLIHQAHSLFLQMSTLLKSKLQVEVVAAADALHELAVVVAEVAALITSVGFQSLQALQ